tara:strand:- start:455 stop:973 length:519 start_codon:yes stop_codon:yes gene_type:complete
MAKKKTTLVNESVIRRWGKLANMAPLTESYIDTLEEEDMEIDAEIDLDAADGAEEEMMDSAIEMEDDAAIQMSEEDAEVLVKAIADAVSQVTGIEVDVESEEEAAGLDDAAMDLEGAADDLEGLADDEAGMGMGAKAYNRTDEELQLNVIDDEALTEVVLKRVVERLLSRKS